jgi:hypothetical protein
MGHINADVALLMQPGSSSSSSSGSSNTSGSSQAPVEVVPIASALVVC